MSVASTGALLLGTDGGLQVARQDDHVQRSITTARCAGCTHLLELHVAYNALESLPMSLARLGHLVCLNVSGNALTELPPVALAHPLAGSLQWLWLSNNRLSALPDVSTCAELRSFSWHGNSLPHG